MKRLSLAPPMHPEAAAAAVLLPRLPIVLRVRLLMRLLKLSAPRQKGIIQNMLIFEMLVMVRLLLHSVLLQRIPPRFLLVLLHRRVSMMRIRLLLLLALLALKVAPQVLMVPVVRLVSVLLATALVAVLMAVLLVLAILLVMVMARATELVLLVLQRRRILHHFALTPLPRRPMPASRLLGRRSPKRRFEDGIPVLTLESPSRLRTAATGRRCPQAALQRGLLLPCPVCPGCVSYACPYAGGGHWRARSACVT